MISGLFENAWTMVTVAWCLCNNKNMGNPTILLLPITTAFLPFISTSDLSSNSMQPLGVHGMNKGSFPCTAKFPMLSGWKPSTSFSRLSIFSIFSLFKCCGKGSCTRMPWIDGSSLKLDNLSQSSSSVQFSGR
nr:Uncharacterised protein [Ipomoea batatas]